MARNIIRAIPLFIDGKKFSEVTGGSYDIMSGAEASLGAVEGYLGHMTGWPTTKITPAVIVPIKGLSVPLDTLIISGALLQAGLAVSGTTRFHTIEVVVVTLGFKWDWKTGSCTGDLTLEGGQPVLAGELGV